MGKKKKQQTMQVDADRFNHDEWVSRADLLDALE